MSDLIDRQEAINAIEQMQLPIMRSDLLHEQFIFQGLSEALAAIKELPSAFQDWQKIILSNLFTRKGKWIYGEHDIAMCDGYRCDKCGFFVPWDYQHKSIDFINEYKFCPNCGSYNGGDSE